MLRRAPLSEYYGRRIVFYLCFISYFAFTFLCAFTPNIAGLLVARFLCGAFVAGCVSNTPGIFVDLWGPIERGNCMTLFTCALSMGPAIVRALTQAATRNGLTRVRRDPSRPVSIN